MNLAEIRKKALQERTETPREHGTPPSPFLPEPIPVEVPEIVEPVQEFEEPAPCEEMLPVEPSPKPVAEIISVVPAGEPHPVEIQHSPEETFDPLARILAGREMSTETAEAVEDERELQAERLEFLCFRVANEIYAVNILELKEIIKLRDCTEVPRMPAYISGVFSLRGLIVPVFDLHARLGLLSGAVTGRERIVVVKKGSSFCGLKVDEVLGVVKIPGSAIEQPPAVLEGIDRDFVIGIGRHESWMIILLNLEKILDVHLA
ncbi:MAG: chemotaxis protein CheW [Geobacter sp.]|nr:chemotaxis protein CheW [Geobacter sp.]